MKYIRNKSIGHYSHYVNGVKNVFIGQEYCIFQRIYGQHVSGDSRIVRRGKNKFDRKKRIEICLKGLLLVQKGMEG